MYRILVLVSLVLLFLLLFFDIRPRYDEPEIRIGMSAPFSGNLAPLGESIYLGANTYLRYINENGGVHGRTLRLINKDDKYEPKITAENVETLILKERVYVLMGVVGTPTAKVALPLAQYYNVPFIGAFTGADFLQKDPRDPLVLNTRTSYEKEIEKIIEYFVDKRHFTKIAVFYQNDSYGRTGLRNVKKALKKYDLQIMAEGSYKRNTLSVGHALYELSQNKPQGIVMVGATKPTAKFIQRARAANKLQGVTYAAISFAGSDLLVDALDKKVDNLIFSQVVPSPWTSKTQEVSLYRELMDRYNPHISYSYASLEGYFMARMVVELFKNIGADFSKQDFLEAMENLYMHIKNNPNIAEEERLCKCLNKVYLTEYKDGAFWDMYGED